MPPKRSRGRNVQSGNPKSAKVPKVRDLLQEDHSTTAHQSRYSRRVRKQFHPFTIPRTSSSKAIKHVGAGVKKGNREDGLPEPARSSAARTSWKGKRMDKKEKGKRMKETKLTTTKEKRKRHKNDLLKPRSDIEDFSLNPYLFSSKPPRFVSVFSYSRIIAHRLVFQKDVEKLRRTAYDATRFNVDAFMQTYCGASKLTAEGEAVLTEDKDLLRAVLAVKNDDKAARAQREPVLLSEHSSGQMNRYMLGHATANIQMTRGGREGINALLDGNLFQQSDLYTQLHIFVRGNVSIETLLFLEKSGWPYFSDKVYRAVRYGHRQLAAYMIAAFSSYNFNDLHVATLKNNTQPLKKFMPISVTKKGRTNRDITPFHTAAINPNVSYLKTLLASGQQYGPDSDGWDLIHYAAVCEGSGPLKHLLSMGISPIILNKKKQMPLHCAAKAGREENVKILISAIQKHEDSMQLRQTSADSEQNLDIQTNDGGSSLGGPPPPKRRKIALMKNSSLINAKSTLGKTALHWACARGHEKVVEVLLNAANIIVDVQTSAANKKLTPLMVACTRGHLDIANILIDVGGAVIEKGDKLKKTALTHAVINGQAHIVAMLLRRGASPLSSDTSGNTPAHYAAAFGWLECLMLLTKADPCCLSKSNDWQLTPLSVAFLKGHYGIVEWLVDGPYSNIVSVNCRDHSGTTLLSSVVKFHNCFSDKTILKQLQFLLEKGADCSLKDANLNSPFHYFCSVKCKLHVENAGEDVDESENSNRLTKDEYRRCVDLLIKSGAKVTEKNDQGYNALHLAIKAGNLYLTELILEKMMVEDPTLQALEIQSDGTEDKADRFLHDLIALPFQVYSDRGMWARKHGPAGGQYNIIPLLDKLISVDRNRVRRWLWQRDTNGQTPLLLLCQRYSTMQWERSGNAHERCLKQFLSTLCAVVRHLAPLDAKILLQRVDSDHVHDVSDNRSDSSNESGDDGTEEENDTGDETADGSFQNNGAVASTGSPASSEAEDPTFVPLEKVPRKKEKASVLSYALQANCIFSTPVITVAVGSETYGITNKLLTTVVEAAKEFHVLQELLSGRDGSGYTPLLRTINNGDLGTSMYLLRLAHSVSSNQSTGVVDTAVVKFHYSAAEKKFIPWNKSVLMFAVEKSMLELIEELRLERAEWNACTHRGSNAFHFAARVVSFKSVALYELLKRKGVEQKANEDGQYPVHIAVASLSKTDVDVLTEPLEWFTKSEVGLFARDNNGCLPLHYCFIPRERDVFAKMTIDPVAILSVLLDAMQKKMINQADNIGYAALHYAALFGANICAVTLLQAGANQNATNCDGNTPLALAVLRKHEACTLTLIQAKSDVVKEVHLAKRTKKERDERSNWVWIPKRRAPEKVKLPDTIPSLIVRNEWQGIVYVLLSVLGKNVLTVGSLLRAALQHRKYNLAQTLLGTFRILLQDESAAKIASVLEELNLLLVFVENLGSDIVDERISKALDGLLSLGCKWYSKQKNGRHQSRVVEHLASNGQFQFMRALYDADQKSAEPMWDLIYYGTENDNPLVGIVETWIKSGPKDGIKFWLKHFAEKFGINSLMLYQRPAFDGMFPCLPKQPVAEFCRMTPLIRAILCTNIELVKFLLQDADLQTDVNQPDEFGVTPLMHACMVNSDTIVQLLFDPTALERKNDSIQGAAQNVATNVNFKLRSAQNNAGIGGLFGGFGNYSGVDNQSASGDVESLPSNSQVAATEPQKTGGRNAKKKFLLKTNLDPFKQCSISGRFASEDEETKCFLHFMLEPCGWENVDLLETICRSFPLAKNLITQSEPQRTDRSPMCIARNLRQTRILDAMKSLVGRSSSFKVEYPLIDISGIKTKYNIDADCGSFLAQDAEARRERMKREFAKSFLKPHENSGYRKSGEVCMKQLEDSDPIPYKVLLTTTDINRGVYGYHNYYRMELVRRKGSELYILFTNWGRIGDPIGQYQRTPFGTLEDADKEFSSIFRAKTGNEFANIKNFDEKPMKYRLVKVDQYNSGDIADLEIDFKKSTSIDRDAAKSPSYRIIKDISNVKRLQERTRTVCQYQRSRIPFGCISRSDLLQAQKVLTKLQSLKTEMDQCTKMVKGPEVMLKILQAQSQATNEFYRLMPLGGFENSSLKMIDNDDVFEEYERTLENLFEMEIAGKLITAAAYNMNRIDPYMYILDGLECKLTMLNPDDLMVQRILQNIQVSSSCSVEAIFEVNSREPSVAFNENALEISNHRYLWHGTKPENMLSILKTGLLASPSCAVQTGQAFGQGIYFADVFGKSEGYCTPSSSGLKYIMLCQVALGEIHFGVDSSVIRSGAQDKLARCDTLKVIGREQPDPQYDMTMENGCVLPLGNLICTNCEEVMERYKFYPYLNYSEYIVRDKTLTVVRYLVVFK